MTLTNHEIPRRLVGAGALSLALALGASCALAQVPAAAPTVPTVNVNASATATIPNDRLQAWLRTEAENVSPAAAAAQVNAASAKALADAKAFPGIKVATNGYSTQQIAEKGKPTRWRPQIAASTRYATSPPPSRACHSSRPAFCPRNSPKGSMHSCSMSRLARAHLCVICLQLALLPKAWCAWARWQASGSLRCSQT